VAVKIRLMRVGKKKQPTYRVVVADGRSPRDGRFIEIIGRYAPRDDPSAVEIDADSALAWLRKGAQPTERVQKLLAAAGVWAQYEADRGAPAETKLSRRGYVTGRVAPPKKKPEPPAPAADASDEEAPAADESAEADDAAVAEAPEEAPAETSDDASTEDTAEGQDG